MDIEVWVVKGSSDSPDWVWDVHTDLNSAVAHTAKLRKCGVPAIAEVAILSPKGAKRAKSDVAVEFKCQGCSKVQRFNYTKEEIKNGRLEPLRNLGCGACMKVGVCVTISDPHI